MKRVRLEKSRLVVRSRGLRESGYPRAEMSLILALTGGAGFLASFGMLKAGIDSMALRYPLAVAVAYLVFLLLLWIWLRSRQEATDALDLLDLAPSDGGGGVPPIRGGGGSFGGGGATGHFGPAFTPATPSSPLEDLPLVGDAIGAAADADEFAIPLLIVLAVVGVAVASLYVVFLAPMIVMELAVDGALVYTLHRRLRRISAGNWFRAAFRLTALPFAVAAAILALAGFGLQHVAPGADSIGDLFRHP